MSNDLNYPNSGKVGIRKLAVIMFTDIVGYTALMGHNELSALELLRKSRTIQQAEVSKHHGKWLKEMGDGTMVQFENALDAVVCAKEIQERIRNLDCKLRVGIHLGDITLENEDIFGDSVNIAARLQSVADPGSIFISDSVYYAVKGHSWIQSQYIGEIQLKNVTRPIATYAITGYGLPRRSCKSNQTALYENQEFAVRTDYGNTDSFEIGHRLRQGAALCHQVFTTFIQKSLGGKSSRNMMEV